MTKHIEELDGCDHGATGKACRPDPQPQHGKDCEVHGRHGGVNEDHCSATTVTTGTIPTTTSTSTPSTTSTTRPPRAQPNSPGTTSTPSLGCTTPDGQSFLTNIEQGGCPSAAVSAQSPVPATVRSDLPHTGGGVLGIPVGIALVCAGLALRRAARR